MHVMGVFNYCSSITITVFNKTFSQWFAYTTFLFWNQEKKTVWEQSKRPTYYICGELIKNSFHDEFMEKGGLRQGDLESISYGWVVDW